MDQKHFEISTESKEGKRENSALQSSWAVFISHLSPSTSSYNVRLYLTHGHLSSITFSLNVHALGLNRLCVTWSKDVISDSWASTWWVLCLHPHIQKKGKNYHQSLNPVTIFNSWTGISCSKSRYYFYIHIMKHVLYHLLPSSDSNHSTCISVRIQVQSMYPNLRDRYCLLSRSTEVLIPWVNQARISTLLMVWELKKKQK